MICNKIQLICLINNCIIILHINLNKATEKPSKVNNNYIIGKLYSINVFVILIETVKMVSEKDFSNVLKQSINC